MLGIFYRPSVVAEELYYEPITEQVQYAGSEP